MDSGFFAQCVLLYVDVNQRMNLACHDHCWLVQCYDLAQLSRYFKVMAPGIDACLYNCFLYQQFSFSFCATVVCISTCWPCVEVSGKLLMPYDYCLCLPSSDGYLVDENLIRVS